MVDLFSSTSQISTGSSDNVADPSNKKDNMKTKLLGLKIYGNGMTKNMNTDESKNNLNDSNTRKR